MSTEKRLLGKENRFQSIEDNLRKSCIGVSKTIIQ